jgi:hypothetical protein
LIHMLLAAVLFSLHHWVAIVESRGDYSPLAASVDVSSMTFDETCCYAPFAGRFMWLGQLPAEVDNYERRNASAGVPLFPAAVLGAMGRALGKLEWAFIAADVVFPALALGLLFVVSAGIVQGSWSRLLLAWTTLLISFGPRNFLWQGYDALNLAPDFTRTPQPEISFTILLAGLLLTSRALCSSSTRSAVAAGIVGAVIVASYYFYAIGWGTTLGMLLVLAAAWGKWAKVKQVAVVVAVMIAGATPYIIAAVRGAIEGGQTYLLARMGGFTHAPVVLPLLAYVTGIPMVWKFGGGLLEGQEHKVRIMLLVLLLLAGLGGMNFQILSGYDAQHEKHFRNRLIQPVGFFLVGCWLLSAAEGRKLRRMDHIVDGLLVLVLLNAGARQLYVGNQMAEPQRATRPEVELLAWARSHLPAGSVIGALDLELVALLPAMGPNFSYVPMDIRTLTPSEEIENRCYELAFFLASSPERFYRLQFPCKGRRRSFAEQYSHYSQADRGLDGGLAYKLDYVVDDSGRPVPPLIAANFPHSAIIHVNQRYQLIQLGEALRNQLRPLSR